MNDLPKTRFRGQNLTVWNHLVQRGAITQLRATKEYQIMRLPSRINEIRNFLRKSGGRYIIDDLNKDSGKTVGNYSIYYLKRVE
jgi:hypothetical protein